MDFRDTILTLMPPPRSDEPASLREDILDELADHLTCAYNRELLRGADSNMARQRVLEQFGDPAAMARRLWLEAMKEKIMAQRVLIATCLVVMLACGCSVALAWNWMNQDRLLRSRATAEAIEANRRVAEALAQSQAANQELLKQMREMSAAVLHPVSTDWNPVTFKLTEEAANGPPAVGFSLALTRLEGQSFGKRAGQSARARDDQIAWSQPNSGSRLLRLVLPPGLVAQSATTQFGGMGGMSGVAGKAVYRTSDAAGIAEFGAVPPGDYSFQISKSWVNGYYRTEGRLNVGPGSKIQKSIVCPKTPPERTRVRVRWSWPADLEKEQLTLYAPFVYRYRKLDSGLEWVIGDTRASARQRRRSIQGIMNQAWSVPAVRTVLYGPGRALDEILDRRGLLFWTFAAINENGNISGVARPAAWVDVLTENLHEVRLPTESPDPRELMWETGLYGLEQLIVMRPSSLPGVETGQRRFDILAGSFASMPGSFIQLRAEPADGSFQTGEGPVVNRGGPPTKKDLETRNSRLGGPGLAGDNAGWKAMQEVVPVVELPPEFWDKVDEAFEARPGQVNEWTIPVPDELIKAVRTALKVDPNARVKPAGTAPSSGGN
jgi:hypothetical protein